MATALCATYDTPAYIWTPESTKHCGKLLKEWRVALSIGTSLDMHILAGNVHTLPGQLESGIARCWRIRLVVRALIATITVHLFGVGSRRQLKIATLV